VRAPTIGKKTSCDLAMSFTEREAPAIVFEA